MEDEINELKARVEELETKVQNLENDLSGLRSAKVRISLLSEAIGVLLAEPAISEAARRKIGDCLHQL